MSLITGMLIGSTHNVSVLLKEANNMTRKQIDAVCYFLMVAYAIIEDTFAVRFHWC
jgi:hypothetical protein